MIRLIAAVAFWVMAAGAAQAQLYAAIAPETRTGKVDGERVTFFMTALNNTETDLTQCRPVFPNEMNRSWNELNYRTVDAENQLTGTANTPVSIAAGSSQGFIFSFTSERLENLIFSPSVECSERTSEDVSGFETRLRIVSSETADIIAIGVTPSADGVVRIGEPGGAEVFATAGINIGDPEIVEVRVRSSGALPSLARYTVCETGTDGACLLPPSDSVTANFDTDEVRTFSVFVSAPPNSGIAFTPDLQRAQLIFNSVNDGRVVGATSTTFVAPAPENADQVTGIYHGFFRHPAFEGSEFDRTSTALIGVGPEGDLFAYGEGDFQRGNFHRWAMTGTPELNGNTLTLSDVLVSTTNGDQLWSLDLEAAITPQTIIRGGYTPGARTEGVETSVAGGFVAIYDGFLTGKSVPASSLVGQWAFLISPSNPQEIGSIDVATDLSFSGTYPVGCPVTGQFTQPLPGQNYLATELTLDESSSACAGIPTGSVSGFAYLPDETDPPLSNPMAMILVDRDQPGIRGRIYLNKSD